MTRPKRRIASGKRKGKIKLTQRARIIEKNDATRVARYDTIPPMPLKTRIPDNAATFKIKIRRK